MNFNNVVSKGYYRAAKCHLVMGSIGNATNYLQKVLEKDPKNKDAQNDVSIYLEIKQYYCLYAGVISG